MDCVLHTLVLVFLISTKINILLTEYSNMNIINYDLSTVDTFTLADPGPGEWPIRSLVTVVSTDMTWQPANWQTSNGCFTLFAVLCEDFWSVLENVKHLQWKGGEGIVFKYDILIPNWFQNNSTSK